MKFEKLYESFNNERDIEKLAKTILNNYADFIMRIGPEKTFGIDKLNRVKWTQVLDFEQMLF